MDLLNACVMAFITVFALLSLLALAKFVITALFPEREEGPDPVHVAAIAAAVAALIPGARVTKVEEER